MITYTTRESMQALDDLALAHGLTIPHMMELSGVRMLSLCTRLHITTDQNIVIITGKGNNGGNGFSAARHLVNYGYSVTVILTDTIVSHTAQTFLQHIKDMNVDIIDASVQFEDVISAINKADIIIDGMLGYNGMGEPRGIMKKLIPYTQTASAITIAIDVPTGVDANTNKHTDIFVQADMILALAASKEHARKYQHGTYYVADIGIPHWMYEQAASMPRPMFDTDGLSEITLQ